MNDSNPGQIPQDSNIPEPFLLTQAQWCNRPAPKQDNPGHHAKVLAHGGAYDQYQYGGWYPHQPEDGFGYHPERGDGPLQVAVLCGPTTSLLGIDVDTPGAFPGSETGRLLARGNAWCTRGEGFHIAVDVRGLDTGKLIQGRTAWGDIKWRGFIPLPGSLHYTGEPYAPNGAGIVTGWQELIAANLADRASYAAEQERLRALSPGRSGGSGSSYDHDTAQAGIVLRCVLHGMTDEQAREEWEKGAAHDWPDCDEPGRMGDEEFSRHLASALRKERQFSAAETSLWESDALFGIAAALSANGHGEASPPAYAVAPAFFPRHPEDQQLALACLDEAAAAYRWCTDTGQWVAHGSRPQWEVSADTSTPAAIVSRLAWRIPRGVKPEPVVGPLGGLKPKDWPDMTDEEKQYTVRGWFMDQVRAAKIASKIQAGAGTHASSVRKADLDADPGVLWAGDQPVTLADGSLGAPGSGIPHLRDTGYPPVSGPCPLFDRLCEAMWPDTITRAYTRLCLATGLSGIPNGGKPIIALDSADDDSGTDAAPVTWNTGNGKSAIIVILDYLLGSYAGRLRKKLLLAGGLGGSHDSDLMSLAGLRLAFLDEAPPGTEFAYETLKDLTGGLVQSGRAAYEHGSGWSFTPRFTLVLASNYVPPLREDALRRRIRRIRCLGDPSAVRAAVLPLLDNEHAGLRAEAPFILAMLLGLCRAWLADPGLLAWENTPDELRAAENQALAAQDNTGRFFTETLVTLSDGWRASQGLTSSQIHAWYTRWCVEHTIARRDVVPLEGKYGFGVALRKRYGEPLKDSRGRQCYPVRYQPEALYGSLRKLKVNCRSTAVQLPYPLTWSYTPLRQLSS